MNTPKKPIVGKLVRAGKLEMVVRPGVNEIVAGLIIEIPQAELEAIDSLPMYRRVVVVPEAEDGEWKERVE